MKPVHSQVDPPIANVKSGNTLALRVESKQVGLSLSTSVHAYQGPRWLGYFNTGEALRRGWYAGRG